MADILRGYGIARESAYFKQEQEAEIQRHRSKLIKEGKIEAGDGPAKIRRDMSLKESAKAYEVVPEILGQGARIDDPHAAAKREFQRRRKAQLPPLSAAELEEYATRTALKSDALSGVVPRIDLRRNRYNAAAVYEHASSGAVMHRTLPPEVQEVAGRAYNASMRAAGYGSLLAITGVALATAYTLQQHDITDTHALRDRIQQWMGPMRDSLQQRMQPYKEYVASLAPSPPPSAPSAPPSGAMGHARPQQKSEFAEELSRFVTGRQR